jgi:hypothetical protein
MPPSSVNIDPISTKPKETLMSNRSIIIMVLVLIGATAYLLLKGDGNVDMSGEKHGAEATHVEEAKKDALAEAPAAPAAPAPAAPAADAKK